MTALGLYLVSGVLAASTTSLTKPGDERPASEAVLKINQAIAKLRLGRCAEVLSAKLLLDDAKAVPEVRTESEKKDFRELLDLAEESLQRRNTALDCSNPKAPTKVTKPAEPRKEPKKEPPTEPKKVAEAAAPKKPEVVHPGSPVKPAIQDNAETIYAGYTRAKKLATSLLAECPGPKTAANSNCKERLDLASQLQSDLAFESLRVVPEKDERWAKLRQEICISEPNAKKLLEAIQRRLLSGGMSIEDAQTLLDTPREKLDLAEQLSDSDNTTAIWKIFLESAKETFTHKELEAIRRKKVDWAVVFAHLTNLSDDKWRILYERMLASGKWIPHHNEAHLRRDEFRMVYAFQDGIKPDDVVGFTDRFSALIQGLSPVGAREPEFRSDLSMNRTTQLLSSARRWMLAPFGCKGERGDTPKDPFEHHLFCGSYVGILVVEFQLTNDKRTAVASWIRHVQGSELKEMPRKAEVPVPSAVEKRLEVFQTSAEVLARRLAGEETLFPAIARLVQLPTPSQPTVPPPLCAVPPPCPPHADCPTRPECPPTPPPPAIEGTAWHAFLFAGLPYLEDSKGGTGARLIASGLDLATLFGSLAALRWSIHERNRYSTGSERSFGDANDYLKTSGYLLLGALAVRSAAAICYWNDDCRRWTRR